MWRLRTLRAWNLSLSAQRLHAQTCANSHSKRRTQALPFLMRPLFRFPADSLLPGHMPTQLASRWALPKTLMSAPNLHQQHGRAHHVNAGQGLQQLQRSAVTGILQGTQQLRVKAGHTAFERKTPVPTTLAR